MFSVGSHVCYPMFGIATIEGIERRQVLGVWEEYYVLQLLHDRMTVLVPVEKAGAAGLRHLSTGAECERVFTCLQSADQPGEQTNWNKRYRENLDKLRRGDLRSTAEVVQSLRMRDRKRGLSSGERRMYQTACRILREELSLVDGRWEQALLSLMDGEEKYREEA